MSTLYHCQKTYILKLITRALAGHKLIMRALAGCKRGVHYKFGVQVPNDYNHTVELDAQNKNKEW